MSDIGKKILIFRTYHLKLHQSEFATASGVSKKSIHNYEVGNFEPRPDMIARIEKAFNVKLDTVRLIPARVEYEKCE